ncbi:MAG: endonuclease domain-containing protein [Hyphomonadaceae bacterium]|nr:endonuclease domain-containing protein [Hyphomonadaceae bacterium]
MADKEKPRRFSSTPERTERARSLRRDMTKAEWLLWRELRSAPLGVSFRRQHPIGPYYAYFCCVPLKIVIELDGSQHADDVGRDRRRTAYLNEQGFEVLRFWNNEVRDEMEGVWVAISDLVRKRMWEQGKL